MSTFARVKLADGRAMFSRRVGDELKLLDDAPWSGGRELGSSVSLASAHLLAPVVPSKIVCVGRNYRAHAAELGHDVPAEPLLFFKPPSAVIGPEDEIVMPRVSARVDHEGELGVIIGSPCKDVRAADALGFVFGYTCVNDVTARDLQKKDGQWARAKGFDTFCPVGPWILTELDPTATRVRCRVGTTTRQDGNTSDMMFSVAAIIEYVSGIMTLEPGDLIATGTPEGVGPLAHGDVVEVEVDGIGVLRNPVRAMDA